MLTLKVLDKERNIRFSDSHETDVGLVVDRAYEEGDIIVLESAGNEFVLFQADDAMGEALVYLTGTVEYTIPFGEKRVSYSPKAFSGELHYLYAKKAKEYEIYQYRNLAQNVYDQHGDTHCFPHAYANVETRGEAVFAARNAIDGITENRSHGPWPYESWGINRQDDAEITIDFGRKIKTDRIVIYTRADFPHDNWWVQGTLIFSDGSEMICKMEKSRFGHEFRFPEKEINWVKLEKLMKADDPSPFPALSQIAVWGHHIL